MHLFFSRPAANPRLALSGRDQSERSAEGKRPGSPSSRRLRLRAGAAARESNSSELRRRREPGAGDALGARGGCCPTRRGGNPASRRRFESTARRPCPVALEGGDVKRETASGIRGNRDPGREAAPGGRWQPGGCGVRGAATDWLGFRQSSASPQHLMVVS